MFPFITPTSRIWRGSTCPSRQGAVQVPLAIASRSAVRPTAPLYVKAAPGSNALPGTYDVPSSLAPSVVAGSPGAIIPGYTVLKTFGNSVPGWPFAISASPDSGPKENMYV